MLLIAHTLLQCFYFLSCHLSCLDRNFDFYFRPCYYLNQSQMTNNDILLQ